MGCCSKPEHRELQRVQGLYKDLANTLSNPTVLKKLMPNLVFRITCSPRNHVPWLQKCL